jgi:hypothetical protein
VTRALAAVVFALSACLSQQESATSSSAAIIGGQPAPGDVSVFFLANDAGVCSATLIAPRTLLTAAHCVEALPSSASNEARVDVGGASFAIVDALTYAQATGGTADLALLLLDRAPAVAPMGWIWWGPPPFERSPVRHVGYGRTETNPPGERRAVTSEVTGAVENRGRGMVLVTGNFGQGLCFGDSGGAALVATDAGERLVAVHSFITQACGEGVSSSVLIYPYRRFIEAWLATREPADCARDGRCVTSCPFEDPDCRCGADAVCRPECPELDDPDCPGGCRVDGVCSERADCPAGDGDCIADGAPCLNAMQCAGRACVNDPQNVARYCSGPCPAQPCPETMACDQARGVCILKPLPTVKEGASCSPLVKCEAGTACTDLGTDRRCLRTCTSQAQCLTGTRCRFGTMSVCVPQVRIDAGTSWEGPTAKVGCSTAPHALWWLLVAFVARRFRFRPCVRTGSSPAPSSTAG